MCWGDFGSGRRLVALPGGQHFFDEGLQLLIARAPGRDRMQQVAGPALGRDLPNHLIDESTWWGRPREASRVQAEVTKKKLQVLPTESSHHDLS